MLQSSLFQAIRIVYRLNDEKGEKLRRQLGASADLMLPVFQKPRGMHRNTFECLVRKEQEVNQAVTRMVARQLGISTSDKASLC